MGNLITRPWNESETICSKRILWIARSLALAEYSCVGWFFSLALKRQGDEALILQICFFGLAAVVEYVVYKKIGSPFKGETLKTILVCPVQRLSIPTWLYYWLALAPNYIHVTSTAVTAGSAFLLWADERFKTSKMLFQQNWSYVPLIGAFIGSQGLPWVLTTLLLVSCIIHLLLLCLPARLVGEVCDAANLQFLTLALKREDYDSTIAPDEVAHYFQYSRLLSCVVVKYPLLWAKTSLLAVTYDFMDSDMYFSTMLSLGLAWYGILQLMPNFCMMIKVLYSELGPRLCKERDPFDWALVIFPSILFGTLCFGLFQQALHLYGVYMCPSHDFSLFLMGCSYS